MNIIEQLNEAAGKERKSTVEFLRLLQVADEQRVFAIYSYSSVFKLCTHELRYSEGAAYRRVSTMRLMRREKDCEEMLLSGEMTLTNAAKIETALRYAEAADIAVDGHALYRAVLGCTSKQADKKIEEFGLKPAGKLASALEEKIEKLKELLGDPTASREELLHFALDEAIALHQPEQGDIAADVKSPEKQNIPLKLRAAKLHEEGHACSFVSSMNGKKCGSKYFLQMDHIIPVAFGGLTIASNLRVLCRTHNLLAAEQLGLGWRKK